MKWISVKDEYPVRAARWGHDILVYDPSQVEQGYTGIFLARIDIKHGRPHFYDRGPSTSVGRLNFTYWMLLPEAPKEIDER